MTDLFDIRLWLYPGADPDANPADWGLEEVISSYLRHPGDDGGQPISYSGGKGDEAPTPDAGQMSLTLDNRDGRFSTDNLSGPYYGDLDTGTPIRMGVASFKDTFTRSASSGWGTADAANSWAWTHSGTASNWAADGSKGTVIIPAANTAVVATAGNANAQDADVRVVAIPAATATGGSFSVGIMLRRTDNSNYLNANLQFLTSGAVRLDIYRVVAGSVTTITTLDPIPSSAYSAGERWVLRAQIDGQDFRAKAWEEAGSEPATWHVTGTDTTATGDGIALYFARFSGNSNSGAATIASADDFTAVAMEFTGSVVSWPVRWDKTGNNSWAPITAAGVLRRLNQGTFPIQSPLRRLLAGTATVTGYWPLEDGSLATSFTSARSGQRAADFTNLTPAQDTTLAGGGPAPVFSSAAGTISAATTKGQGGTGFACMFFFKLSSLPGSKTRIARVRSSSGPVRIWDFSIDAAGVRYTEGLATDGTVLTSDSGVSPVTFTEWTAWQLETVVNGANTDWVALVQQSGAGISYVQSGSYAGTAVSTVASVALTGPSGTAFAHIWMGQNTLPFVDNNFALVSSGYEGELASARFARVAAEAGLTAVVRAGTSEAMGPQREGGTLAVLESCVRADYGVMAERASGLEFIPRSARWNAAVKMAVTVAAGQVDQAPEPVRDDQRLRNKWTITRIDGGEGVFQDDASIAKSGIWEDSDSINTETDAVLENHAAFRVAIGTQARMRWPSVSLNFARNRDLLTTWRGRGYGWRLTVATGMDQVLGNEPDLIVEGHNCQLWPNGWTADLNCSSASVWVAAVADDTGILGRADNEYCETTSLISSTTLSIPITTTSGTRWDNTAGLWSGGVDMYVGGERVTVTSITNGSDPAQTLVCSVRGVNGYALSHASGTKVRLWNPAIVAL